MGTIQHQTGDLLGGEVGGECFCPHPGCVAPILVRVDLSVAVQILEHESVGPDQAQPRFVGISESRSLFLPHQTI